MISGIVNQYLEAILRLKVLGPTGAAIEINAIVDTGFSGELVLSPAMIATLGLIKRSGSSAVLADGSIRHFDTYGAELEWDGGLRKVVVSGVGTEPLMGTALLAGHTLTVNVVQGGLVQIDIVQVQPIAN